MRNLIFKKLYLLSEKEKKAKQVSFNPDTTVVIGANDTGKSSLLKSLYHTLGAEVDFHRDWLEANVISVLLLEIDGQEILVLRYQNLYAIFNVESELMHVSRSITKGLSPYLSELFDFNLRLKHSSSKKHTLATPAFQYLPYYVDQDNGWGKPWASFESLKHFSSWKRDFLDYHSGIKPKEYYRLSTDITEISRSISEKSSESNTLKIAKANIEANQKAVLFDIDPVVFKKDIDKLLQMCNILNEEEERYRQELTAVRNKENILRSQLDIARKSLKEIEKDYEFTLKSLDTDQVECPTCGTSFDNSLLNRFSLVEDAESCRQLVLDISKDLEEIPREIDELESKYFQKQIEQRELQSLLEEKRGEIKLRDVIRSESQKEIRHTFEDSIDECENSISELSKREKELKKERNSYTDKERTDAIKKTYNNFMLESLPLIEVFGLSEDDYRDIPTEIKETGSDHPRALLAYYYSFLKTMQRHSTSMYFPVVIDSPNQQDQDEENLLKIMEFAINRKPESTQLILGSVELYGVDYSGYTIELKDKRQLLQGSEYEVLRPFVRGLLDKAIDSIAQQP